MKKTLLLLLLVALSGGQGVFAAPPVVELSPDGGGSVVRPAVVPPAGPAQAPAVVPVAPRAPVRNPAAELLLMIDQLQEEVRFLRGRIEEQDNQLRRMSEDGRDRYRDLDRRISLLTQQLAVTPPPTGAVSIKGGTEGAKVAASSAPNPVPNTAGNASLGASEQSLPGGAASSPMDYGNADTAAYKDAFALVRQRAFPEALVAFASFIERFPQSELVANVLYWTGEVERAKAAPDLTAAQRAYSAMLARFPGHPKAAEAYYKLGLTYEGLGDRQQARAMMQTVVDRYADQSSAKLAREYLARN